ncbi:acyltransferase [Gordonia sp. zg691]|uniref:acyltransferase n=1 Tax=Gordonia jinghuaiqii TaxID=2758710 RepID=UPI0016627D4C|nr:acyltransferase [Gordonia jinghuaiqii]MBD0863959.1 acyltransferase [Gordonia jinghuaiqii]
MTTIHRKITAYLSGWIVNGPAASYLVPAPVRRQVLRWAGAQVGRARILPSGTFRGELSNLEIGDGVFINTNVSIFPTGGIVIGDNVHFGPNCTVMTGSHTVGPEGQRAGSPTQYAHVEVGSGAWLGASVTVCPGVTIGDGCVVAPGAVVVDDLEPNGFYAGVPARLKYVLKLDSGDRAVPVESMESLASGGSR